METELQELLPSIKKSALKFTKEFDKISEERRKILNQLAAYISYRLKEDKVVYLNFICTHNSRRSHISQIWAKTAAHFYGYPEVTCFSGGTEATAVNERTVKAMQHAGFKIVRIKEGENPVYSVMYAEGVRPLQIFSKRFDHPENMADDFAAIMTCSHADENCPFIPGASLRLPIKYEDPKNADGTSGEAEKYNETMHEIGREMFYVFSVVK
jgi:arsenate reductase (thioredoxin)